MSNRDVRARLTRTFACVVVLLLALAQQNACRAQTDEIQVYDGSIAGIGEFEGTYHSNFTPIGRRTADFPGGIVPNHSLNGTAEWAYGVTDYLELGAYLPVWSLSNRGNAQFDGGKVRALLVSPNAADRTFFYGLNLEFSINTPHWDAHRYGLELRPILGVHLDKWDIIVNPIIDTGFDGFSNAHFAPAERIAWNANETWALALEHYGDFGRLSGFDPVGRQYHELFAVADYKFDAKTSMEFGVGYGLTGASDRMMLKIIFNHTF